MFPRRNEMGFTLIELLIVIAIIAMIGFALAPKFFDRAHGAMVLEINTFLPAEEGTVHDVAKALTKDTSMTVTVMVYAAKWDFDAVSPMMSQARSVQAHLNSHGVPNSRIVIGMSNEGGLAHYDKVPEKDGIYLILE